MQNSTYTDGYKNGWDGADQAAPRSDEEDADTGHDSIDEAMVSSPVATHWGGKHHRGLLLNHYHVSLLQRGRKCATMRYRNKDFS